MPLIHWVPRGTGIPTDKDEVNRREVCECDGWVCDLDSIGDPSRLRLIRKAAALARIFPTLDLSTEEKAARRSWKSPRSVCASCTSNSLRKKKSVYKMSWDLSKKSVHKMSSDLSRWGCLSLGHCAHPRDVCHLLRIRFRWEIWLLFCSCGGCRRGWVSCRRIWGTCHDCSAGRIASFGSAGSAIRDTWVSQCCCYICSKTLPLSPLWHVFFNWSCVQEHRLNLASVAKLLPHVPFYAFDAIPKVRAGNITRALCSLLV
jgi:hypothetical protein